MAIVQLYGLKKCSTCVKARAWLEEHGVAHGFTDYREEPVAPKLLAEWADSLGGWEKLVNRASMTWRQLPAERKSPQSPEEWLDLIAEFPALVRRPVAIDMEGKVSTGFSDKKYSELFA